MSTLDLVITNGRVADGTGAGLRRADVGIKGDKVAAVGQVERSAARSVIDAAGRVVAPGFIDIHTHSDATPLLDPFAASKLFDGVTTEVSGNCGFSQFPMWGDVRERRAETFAKAGHKVDWTDAAGYFEHYRAAPKLNNRAFVVGQGTIRACIMGYEDRPATDDELARMKHEVAKAMDQGALGISSGLIYPPGCYTPTEELVELCQVAADKGGYYATHIRGEGDSLEKAITEALDIGRRTGIPVQIAHLKTSGRRNWHKIDWLGRTLREAIDAGQDVLCDRYTYIASSTGLSTCVPQWVHDGGHNAAMDRMRDAKTRQRIADEANAERDGKYWESIVIAGVSQAGHKHMEGKSVAALAADAGKPGVEFTMDLLLAEKCSVQIVQFGMCEDNLKRVLSWPFVMIASDAGAKSLAGRLAEGKPHPRGYGAFCRALGKYCREERVFTLEECIRHMTSLPAQRLGFADRGRLAPGGCADVVVFDPDTVSDRATFTDPHQYSTGIDYVLVNGAVAIKDGRLTGAMAGKLLTR